MSHPIHWFIQPRTLVSLVLGSGMIALALPGSQLFASSPSAAPGVQANALATLVSGRRITPVGSQTKLWNLPMNAVLSPDGKHLLVANAGAYDPEMLQSVDTSTRRVVQSLPYRSPSSVSPSRVT